MRKRKMDRDDARLLLRLMLEDRFPQIWVASWENRDLRQLLWHRHRMVQARTRLMNQLQAVALNEGLRCKKKLWRDHRKGRAISVWETDRLLSGTGAPGGLERRTETAGAYHEARQCSAALLVSGICASYGTHDSAMAQ